MLLAGEVRKQMEQEKPKFDLDELPMPTSENNGK